ncbi:MAG: glycosyltransferase, partial [Pseudomonadales bacterium]
MKNCLVVLGMHRSGTSALTGLLEHLGVDLGETLLETQPDNEKGFFENKFVVETNDAILEAVGSSWDDSFPLPDDWQSYFNDSRMAADISGFLKREFQSNHLSALKDPRLCRLLPYWLPLFAGAKVQPHFAIVARNPLEIAESLHTRNGFSLEKSLLLWMQYMLDAEAHTRHLPRGFVHFDAILDSPKESIERLFNAADLPQPDPSATNEKALASFLDDKLRHHTADATALLDQGFDLAARLYDVFCNAAISATASENDCRIIDEIREDFDRHQRFYFNRDLTQLRHEVLQRESPEARAQILKSLRQQFEADQLQREYRYIANTGHLNKEIHSLLEQRNALNSDRDEMLADRDALIAERNDIRKDRDALIAERDGLRDSRDAIFKERDELRGVRDALIVQRDEFIVEREAFVKQRDELLNQREEFIEQREQLIVVQNDLIAQRDQALAERDNSLQQRDSVIAERENAKREITELKADRDRHSAAREAAISESDAQRQRADSLEEELRFFWNSRVGKLYSGYQKTVETLSPASAEQRYIHKPATPDPIVPGKPPAPEKDLSAKTTEPAFIDPVTQVAEQPVPDQPAETVSDATGTAQVAAEQVAAEQAVPKELATENAASGPPSPAHNELEARTDATTPLEDSGLPNDQNKPKVGAPKQEELNAQKAQTTDQQTAELPEQTDSDDTAQNADAKAATPELEQPTPEAEPQYQPLSFPASAAPVTSIVIPVFNNWAFTYACLRSVHEHTTGEYEVIVVDNNSTDETPKLLAQMQGITVISNESNEVFVNACNQAAQRASGRYLMLLNNDTEGSPGWLEAMLEPFSEDSTGIVGAKLVYPDGRLQEAGGIIWADGTGCN